MAFRFFRREHQSCCCRRKTLCREGMHHLSCPRWHGTFSLAEWHVWRPSSPCRWLHRHRRRRLYPRIDSATKRKNCGRISAHDANLPGTIDGGADSRSHCLHQVTSVAANPSERRRDCAAYEEQISYEPHAASAIERIAGYTLIERHLRLW